MGVRSDVRRRGALLTMSGLDRNELCGRLVALRVLRRSGRAEQSAAHRGLGGAIGDLTAEPFTAGQLLGRVRSLLDDRVYVG